MPKQFEITNLDELASALNAIEDGTITPEAGKDLILQAVSGKDVKIKLTDAGGARKVEVIDSATAVVFSVDSDGNVIGTLFTGNVAGNVVGNVAGNVAGNLTAGTGANLLLTSVAAKDIIAKLGDAIGAKKLLIHNSSDALVASIDSNGKIVAGTGASGGVQGNYATKALTGTAPTNAEMITAFGAVSGQAGATGVYQDSSGAKKVYSCVCDGVKWYAVECAAGA